MEENPGTLYDATIGLPPMFLFQEGDDPRVAEVFKEHARLTKGAYERFDPGAARELAEQLRAVAAFSVGGLTALADLRTDGARKLRDRSIRRTVVLPPCARARCIAAKNLADDIWCGYAGNGKSPCFLQFRLFDHTGLRGGTKF